MAFFLYTGRGGFNMYPTPTEFRRHLQNIITYRMSATWINGNCQYNSVPMLLNSHDIINCPVSSETTTVISEDFDDDDDVILDAPVTFEDCTVAYFAGFISYACEKKFRCENCFNHNRKIDFSLQRETLIFNRAYQCRSGNALGQLHAPSDIFFNIINLQLGVFSEKYPKLKNQQGLREKLIAYAKERTDNVYPNWFLQTNKCFPHRLFMLNKLFTTKLLKTGIWETENIHKTDGQNANSKKRKLLNI